MISRLLCLGSLFLLGICFAQEAKKQADIDPVKQNELRATGVVRTLNTSAITYLTTYEKTGYPPTLNSMAKEDGSQEYNEEHAGLITEDLGCKNPPCAFRHYLFSYTKTKKGYVVTARPEAYGVSGKLSLYSDQTVVIRATFEDREATADDLPVDTLLAGTSKDAKK
jgi:hypothetical protein